MATTIQIDKDIRKELEDLKIHKRESLNDVISRLIKMSVDTEPLSKEEIEGIEASLEDIKQGSVYTTEEVKKQLELR